ncbi:hypothetical protein Tco_0247742 [Tanacetum coccineum]
MAEKSYQDLLPIMAEKLELTTFMEELCGGFRLLADENLGLITPESLRKNASIMYGELAKKMQKHGDGRTTLMEMVS